MIRVYVDMDHTFCDFEKAKAIWKNWGVSEIEQRIPWSMPGFFSSLLPMEGAIEFWKEFEDKVELFFLTRPSFQNRNCYTEKADWVYRYLGEEGVKKLIISPRKDILIGDILIDDSTNCGQSLFQGEFWQFGLGNYCPNWKTATDMLHNKIFQTATNML